ncbi:MAG: S-adenosylmethionine:tRNA ribosyltransferase-isomerase [Holophagaceae bacterium]|nr:S-adenosylmethionine:tRNA ribosyltransferase-isomerase [Holophagaceae bacterium]
MKRSDFHFDLPPELIAQHPATERDGARLLVVDARTGTWSHRAIRDLPELLPVDSLCVPNDVRVRHARLFLRRSGGGAGEALLLRGLGEGVFEAMVKPGARLKPGASTAVVDPVSGRAPRPARHPRDPARGSARRAGPRGARPGLGRDRPHRPPAPPALHRPPGRRGGRDPLPDRVRGAGGRGRGGPHGGPALHAGADLRPALPRLRLAAGPSPRGPGHLPTHDRRAAGRPRHARGALRDPRGHRGPPRARPQGSITPHRLRGHHLPAHPRRRLGRAAAGPGRRHAPLHHAGLPATHRGPPAHQLPPAREHPLRAGLRPAGPGGGAGGLRRGHPGALPIFQLR